MNAREIRLATSIAALLAALWWFGSLINACQQWLSIFSKGSCISVFQLEFGPATFWFYNLFAALALFAAIYLYKTLPEKDAKPSLEVPQPSNLAVADLSSAEYQVYLINRYKIVKNEVLNKYICDDKLFDSVESALEHAHHLNTKRPIDQPTTNAPSKEDSSGTWDQQGKSSTRNEEHEEEFEKYNITYDEQRNRYFYQGQPYFDAETAVTAARTNERKATKKRAELVELSKYDISFDEGTQRYVYKDHEYYDARDAVDAAMLERNLKLNGVVAQGSIGSTGQWTFKEFSSGKVVAQSNSGQELIFESMIDAKKYFYS
jgi:hypothetical protein